jgi:hypothetical protein
MASSPLDRRKRSPSPVPVTGLYKKIKKDFALHDTGMATSLSLCVVDIGDDTKIGKITEL